MAIFDYDWTLVKPISNGTFSKNVDDWSWITAKVPEVLNKYYESGFCIAIVSNQTRNTAMKISQINNVLSTLNFPSIFIVGYDDDFKKPKTAMFDILTKDKKVDYTKSFYVGDALGRQGDWSDVDLKFAQNIGMKTILSPDELFSIEKKVEVNNIKEYDGQEIIVMVGYPGSGKSTVSNTFDSKKYKIISGDEYVTSKKMIKVSEDYLKKGVSIIYDSTNPTIIKRKEYIDVANKYKIQVRCIDVKTDITESMFRNNKRDKVIPKITYYVFRKKYEEPTMSEGFSEIITIL
jgi:bifunctional polynucleotide phosphatase/kinase